MGRFLVVGRGRLGTAVAHALRSTGNDAVLVSKSSGIDVTGPVSFAEFAGYDGVVEATDIFTRDARQARDFFVASTSNIKAAAAAAGIARHLLVSIVNCERESLAGNGYYAGKAAQEQAALAAAGPPTTIVRSTLWFEFARQNLERMRFGPFTIVPRIRTRPVALSAVADVVAQRCGTDAPGRHDVCGPEVTTLWQMTQALPGPKGLLIPVPAGRALGDGTLIPADAEVVGPTFDDWLKAAVAQ